MDENRIDNHDFDQSVIEEEVITEETVDYGPLTIESILKNGVSLGVSNFVTIFLALVLWLVTIWIPYLNVGTTIAILTMPTALAKGDVPTSATYIFDNKYRKYMGEFFTLTGLKVVSLIPAFLFCYIPGLVISIGWKLALYILFDKELSPSQSLMESAKLTNGHKWTIFLSEFLYSIAVFVVAAIAFLIAEAIDVSLIYLILIVAVVALSMVGYIGMNTVIYRTLTDEAEAEK